MSLLSRRLAPTLSIFAALFFFDGFARDQDHPKPAEPQSTGVSTGAPNAPVKDSLSRPITVGGFVDAPPIFFFDTAKQAGLEKFRPRSGSIEKATILETPGSVAKFVEASMLGDIKQDYWSDVHKSASGDGT